ncbi:cullin-9 isoform X2 [Stegastes partitus]|uniref:Cullin-9 isoform X2 n=1 Tax=Stegastes partitus TaxID=144197 RepID=A0A9Y4NFV5_9TELE|nr:PREDICTED: cullin-9 isoform X2 [Stegastes partitus]
MVGERRNGNLLVQLGPRLQAYPEELIRQRRTHDGQTEYLIRWCLVTIDDGSSSGGGASEGAGTGGGGSGVGGSGGSSSGETKPENILMWMSTEDVYANCPTLLGKRKTDSQRPLQPQEMQRGGEAADGGQSAAEFPADVTFDEVELSDMKEDVKNLVCRARKQMAKKSDFSINIMHTIHVLSAYASIGSLVGVFKETGALNLLMELLCNKETQTRRSAGKMLRALASHDAGSRAYVLLSLSQQDGIEQHMDFDNRYTLLELFAETTSSEEHGISFEGIHLPQIPGKLLFSLVKRYLCVTSLMDKLNTAGVESSSDRQDASPSPASSSTAHQAEHLRVQREFDFTMAMANLISELVRVMGWDRNRQPPDGSAHHSAGGGVCGEEQEEVSRPVLRSIFQPRFCASPAALTVSSAVAAPVATPPKKKTGNGFKTRSDFASRSAYVEYVQDNLKSGMMVRMLEDYEEVTTGDEGEFRYSNDGSPPVQVYWNSLSRTYWVHWHMVEILGSGSSSQAEKETQEKASSLTETLKLTAVSQTFFSKPPGGLYSLPYLSEGQHVEPAALSRAEWWEILFFIKKLELKQQQEVNSILLQNLDDQEAELDDSSLIGLSVPGDVAKKLLHYLKQKLPSSCLSDLLCSHSFVKHYLRRGGGSLEDEELLAEGSLGPTGMAGAGAPSFSSVSSASTSSSSAMGSVSKKAKKELPSDSGCGSSETDSELPTEDDSKYPDDLEDKMKVFNNPRVQGKKTVLEKLGEVVDILKKAGSGSDQNQQLAAVLFITRLLEEKGAQEKNSMRSDSAQTIRDKVLKLLVELLGSSSRDVVVSTLRLTHVLMLKYEWRVSFATEGGVKAVLSCMQEFSSVAHVQQLALATLKVITGASKHDLRSVGSSPPLSESGTQMMLEIFASIGSATPEGSRGLLAAIPAAIELMLKTKGLSVRNGLLVIIMLISNHKSLAEQLVACDVTAVLKKCLTLSRAETMLAIIALNHISMVHKLDSKECREQLDFKDTELQMLVVSLKELTSTKEVIQTLEQLLCDEALQLEEERNQVTSSRDTYQDLVRLMEQHRADRAAQLSILSVVQVSERFAQYIDQMIQTSGAASGSVETLERLQQFLEPMLFLSGLELANTFEHFYRYYLGDRLLAQGNVWLESAVIDQIGSCFPSRFPQQMMKNLSESAELQQEFHLYRLQQLDRRLQEHDQMMEDEWAESEDEAEVQVLVLSPRCWAVSSLCFLDEPTKHFPSELCSYLNQFTQFYTHSQSMYGLSHSKPRRLQWTWLGHAELQLGCWTLHVSTLQMFILLHFNHHQDVQVESLLQVTGLSAAVLLHALQPLVSDGGPLTCSPPDDPSHGVLRLNQQVVSRSVDGVPVSVQLLPRQTYLNVDEDAAGTLERKRNYIYCLIVHIMKQEKEMHIDNLVFKVLDSCQKQEASRSPGGGSFSCSTGDVLSCIMHVISKGCIRRNEENPHIVEFLPEDPSTPQKGQAQFSFSRAEIRKDGAESRADISGVPALRRFEDGVLDAVLFSMGRTMTQEEVRQLMQRTVQQVSGTLSLDLDRAEHLLVHCKWNVDLLVQRYTDDPDALIMAAGLKCRNPQPPPSPASTCPVCLGPRTGAMEPVLSLSCMHYCCRSCWQEYLTARIEQNLVMNCNCPITDCQAQPTSHFFLSILTDKDTIAKYENALLRGYVECCSNLTWCTNPQGCDQILCKENMGSMGTCSKCCWSSCFSCNFPEAHYPSSCSHMSQWMDDGGYYEGMSMEAQSKHLAKLISKRCPSCQAQIEKNEGCLHMTCAKCNHGFCWRCLKPWKPTHKDYYNCSAMVSKAARQEKKFQDYNERCTFHHQAKDFAVNLENKVSSINEALQMKSLTFVIDACKVLAQARKVLAYSCVYSYYNQETEKMDVMEQQTEALDLHTNALQILLEETLLQCTDLASCVRLLKPEHLNTGLELIRRIQERLLAILQHSTQDFRVGYQTKSSQELESPQASNLSNHTDANKVSKSDRASDSGDSDNNNYTGEEGGEEAEDEDDEYDEEYVPEWHEDYDEDDIDEDDFFSDDDESENLERDFSPFD